MLIKLSQRLAGGVSRVFSDLSKLSRWLYTSFKKTGRILIVDTGWAKGGVCAEIGCLVAERAFEYLRAPVCRVGLPDVPTPAGFTLEQFYYPDVERLARAMCAAVTGRAWKRIEGGREG